MFCMRLISLHCQKNCVWTGLKCHTSLPPNPRGKGGGGVSLPSALHGLEGGDEWHFRIRMDIYVRPGINKGGIQRKHISLLWVGRVGHNEQTINFSMKWCVVWLRHFPYCGTQSKKTVIIKMIFYERYPTDCWRKHWVKSINHTQFSVKYYFSAKYQLTAIFLANSQLTTNFG